MKLLEDWLLLRGNQKERWSRRKQIHQRRKEKCPDIRKSSASRWRSSKPNIRALRSLLWCQRDTLQPGKLWVWSRGDPGDSVPTVFKEVQEEADVHQTSTEVPAQSLESKPDVILEHGKTRLTLDLDGWEWFWLFLALTFLASLLTWLGAFGS